MNEFQTYEYAVSQKTEGKWLLARVLLIFFYIIFVLLIVLWGITVRLVVPLLAFIPISLWIIIFITWRYVSVDYECSVTSGVLTFSKIYGGKSRKTVFEMQLRDAVRIAPLENEAAFAFAQQYAPQRTYSALSSKHAPHIYFILFDKNDRDPQKKQPAIFYFEGNEKILRLCRYYNPSATILETNFQK